MPDIDEQRMQELIRGQAREQAPDAWPAIERRIRLMRNQPVQNRGRRLRRSFAAAGAALVLVAAAFAAVYFTGVLPRGAAPAVTTAAALDGGVRTPTPFTDNTALTPDQGPKMKILFFETIKDLVDSGDTTVVHVKLTKQLGSAPNAGGDPHALFTSYEMQVVKSFKGGLKAGDRITVKTRGGASDTSWLEDDFIEKFTGDFEYVLFLTAGDDGGKTVYGLASPLQGYVPLRGGLVSLNTKIENNGLFAQGETQDALYRAIEGAVK